MDYRIKLDFIIVAVCVLVCMGYVKCQEVNLNRCIERLERMELYYDTKIKNVEVNIKNLEYSFQNEM